MLEDENTRWANELFEAARNIHPYNDGHRSSSLEDFRALRKAVSDYAAFDKKKKRCSHKHISK